MSFKKQENVKKYGFKRFFNSIKYSIEGLGAAYKTEQSLILHAFVYILAIILGFVFHISGVKWCALIISLTVILTSELINTAIETIVDMVTEEYHPLAKIAKDCASAASFVISLATAAVALIIFVPYIIELF